jgi:hypothetical protein
MVMEWIKVIVVPGLFGLAGFFGGYLASFLVKPVEQLAFSGCEIHDNWISSGIRRSATGCVIEDDGTDADAAFSLHVPLPIGGKYAVSLGLSWFGDPTDLRIATANSSSDHPISSTGGMDNPGWEREIAFLNLAAGNNVVTFSSEHLPRIASITLTRKYSVFPFY